MQDDAQSAETITVTTEKIIVSNLVLVDEDLAAYLGEFPEDERADAVRRALKIGLVALKGTSAVEKADYVEKEFGKLSGKLNKRIDDFITAIEKQLDQVFGEEAGVLKKVLDTYLGAGGKLEDLFDPEMKNSAISKISFIFDQHFKGRDSVLYTLLDHTNPESPVAQLKNDLVENYLKEIRNRIVGEEFAEEEREKGTAKGRTYQEIIFEKVNESCIPFQDIPRYVADVTGSLPRSKVGDIVVDVNPAYTGGAPLRIVVEAKDRAGYSIDKICGELQDAKQNRDASVAIAVFTSDTCPGGCYPLQQYGCDKIVTHYDIDEDDALALSLAYRLTRIEALRKLRGISPQMDIPQMRTLIGQCIEKLKAINAIKAKITRLSNEVSQDLDNLRGELAQLLADLDAGTMSGGTS